MESVEVLIIHYNTPELTAAAIRSLWKHTRGAQVTLFDNSDKRPFPYADFPSVTYINNTNGTIINWEEWLAQFPDKIPCDNGYASAKHCYSVDLCFDLFQSGFLLMDSDVLVKRDILPMCDSRYAWVGSTHCNVKRFGSDIRRIIPFLCYINTPMLRKHGIRYFDAGRMWGLNTSCYDTGATLLEDCNRAGLRGHEIDITDYALHLGHASWHRWNGQSEWLIQHRNLWQ